MRLQVNEVSIVETAMTSPMSGRSQCQTNDPASQAAVRPAAVFHIPALPLHWPHKPPALPLHCPHKPPALPLHAAAHRTPAGTLPAPTEGRSHLQQSISSSTDRHSQTCASLRHVHHRLQAPSLTAGAGHWQMNGHQNTSCLRTM